MENTTAGFWLSPQQKYLWSLQQEGGRFAVVSLISMEGPLQLEKLQHTFDQVISGRRFFARYTDARQE